MQQLVNILTSGLLLITNVGLSKPPVLWEMPLPQIKEEIPFRQWAEKYGWKEQRGSAKKWSVSSKGLRFLSADSSTTIGVEVGSLAVEDTTYLAAEFFVDQHPQGANLARKELEDSSLRLFLIFDEGGGWFTPPHTLGFALSQTKEVGSLVPSQRFSEVFHYVMSNTTGKSVQVRLPITKIYRQAFGPGKVPNLKAIGIKSDSNHTGKKSLGWIAGLRIEK